eukprot:TRINITY_DN1363_c0_g2_i6.p2 TRINITY_DN1363_c0_g2~~TRINITY_DN1363_c0_g2_i6.p2  ORF type:complete len:165 (+),score=49.06 TRINITY_DN1363_c0_g2_i6:437-931(+)
MGAAAAGGGGGYEKTAVAMGSSKPKTRWKCKQGRRRLRLAAVDADPRMVLCELCATGEPIDGCGRQECIPASNAGARSTPSASGSGLAIEEQRQREGHGGAGGALEAQEVAAALEQAMQEKVSALVLLAQQEERHVLKTRSVTELQQHQARPSAQLQQEPRKLA